MVVRRHDANMMCSGERTLSLVPVYGNLHSLSRCRFRGYLADQTSAWTPELFVVWIEAIGVLGLVDGIQL